MILLDLNELVIMPEIAQSAYPRPESGLGNPDLPIWQVMPDILDTLGKSSRLALVSETGSGKSTQVPQAMLKAGYAEQGKIFVVENRVTVATEVARRVSHELHRPLGTTVGYITGQEKNVSNDSQIVFMTSGVFKNIIRKDPLLQQASAVIFDEFDERYLLSDIGLALTEKAQEKGSKTKFILMSATLNADKIRNHFAGIPLIEARGRPYPVTPHYSGYSVPVYDMPQQAAQIAAKVNAAGGTGDMLIFMPGKAEIDATTRELKKANIPGSVILPLYAELPAQERSRVFEKSPQRKIIISTNVAERGLTIDGVKYVIDSGLARMNEYDPLNDVSKLGTFPCARDALKQRQGRAGRTQPGEYYTLFTESDYASREASTKPEIMRSPLRTVLLQIKAMGYSREHDPIRLMDAPDKKSWQAAHAQLRMLGALDSDDENKLSAFGQDLAELGFDPRDGAMFLNGCRLGCGRDMAAIAAIRESSKGLLYRPPAEAAKARLQHLAFRVSDKSDLLNLLNAYKQAEANGFDSAWCRENFVSLSAIREIRQNVGQWVRQAEALGYSPENRGVDESVLRRAIASGFPDRVFYYMIAGKYKNLESGEMAILGKDSAVKSADGIIANEFIRIQTSRGDDLPIITAATAI